MENQLKEILEAFPSSFQTFEFVKKQRKATTESILGKLLNQTYDDERDRLIDLNFIAFLYFALGKHDDAIEISDDVLRGDGHKMNALACRAWFHWYKSEFSACDGMCEKLELLKNDKLELLIAKGEVGYAWSRLGITKYKDAEKMFYEALNHSTDSDVHVPDYYICIWKFGLALTIRRQFNINNLHLENISCLDSLKERHNEALKHFIDIIKIKGDSLDKHKAGAYVQIGEIIGAKRNNPEIFDEELLHEIIGSNMVKKARYCFDKGLKLQPDDVFVLEICAKYFRLIGNIDKSIELCRHALCVRETSTAHHYLAVALKFKLESRHQCKQERNSRITMGACKYHGLMDGHEDAVKQHRATRNIKAPTDLCDQQEPTRFRRLDSAKCSMEENHIISDENTAGDSAFVPERDMKPMQKVTDTVYENELTSGASNAVQYLTCETPIAASSFTNVGESGVDLSQFHDEQTNDWQTKSKRRWFKTGKDKQANHSFQDRSRMGHYTDQNRSNTTKDSYGFKHGPKKIYNSPSKETQRSNVYVPTEKVYLETFIKNPKELKPLPRDEICEIITHLERAIQLNENISALYDKGLVMRASGHYDEALNIFKSLFRNPKCSFVYLANAYEQAALCLNEIRDSNKTTKQNIEIDLKEYLLKCLEVTCHLVAKVPQLKTCWSSFPTLKSLLEEKPRTKYVLKELGYLHEKVQRYSEAIGWFKQALELETKTHEKASTQIDIVNNSLKAGNYTEAILNIDMVLCFPDGREKVDENLYFKAHIEGGLKAFADGEQEVGRLRLKNALCYKMFDENTDHQNRSNEEGSMEQMFDVFILCDQNLEPLGRDISNQFNILGLDATLNDDFARADSTVLEGIADVIDSCAHALIILGENKENRKYINILTNIINTTQQKHGYGNTVVITENENVDIDLMFKGFAVMNFGEIVSSAGECMLGMKNLLLMLVSGKRS